MAFFVGGPFIILHGVALAIFGGSAVRAGRALYADSVSRMFGGYLVFGLSCSSSWLSGYFGFANWYLHADPCARSHGTKRCS